MGKIKEYTNGELTVVWEPGLCIHSAKCIAGLPHVFKPKERPWIQLEMTETAALIKTVKTCPSGALTHDLNSEGKKEVQDVPSENTKIEVIPNGPLMVFGELAVKLASGEEVTKSKRTAFCRCGKSDNQPFCDGTHNK